MEKQTNVARGSTERSSSRNLQEDALACAREARDAPQIPRPDNARRVVRYFREIAPSIHATGSMSGARFRVALRPTTMLAANVIR